MIQGKKYDILQDGTKVRLELTDEDKKIYQETLEYNRDRLKDVLVDPRNIFFIEDPQPAGLIPYIKQWNPKARIISRLHIDTSGVDKKNPQNFWQFLKQFWDKSDAMIFQTSEFIRPVNVPSLYMPPCIDITAEKNKLLSQEVVAKSLAQIGVDPEKKFFLCVSRYDPWKGQKEIVKAFNLLKEKYKDVDLYFVGSFASDDPEGIKYYNEIYKLVQSEPRIRMFKNLSDLQVNALQTASQAVLQVSSREGFGLTATEASWKGTPVIVSNRGGLKEQIENSIDGYVVAPEDVRAISKAMSDILDNPKRAKRMAQHARKIVEEKFALTSVEMHRLTLALADLSKVKRYISVGNLSQELVAELTGRPQLRLIFERGRTIKYKKLFEEMRQYLLNPQISERYRINMEDAINYINIYLVQPRNKSPGKIREFPAEFQRGHGPREKIYIDQEYFEELIKENKEKLFELIASRISKVFEFQIVLNEVNEKYQGNLKPTKTLKKLKPETIRKHAEKLAEYKIPITPTTIRYKPETLLKRKQILEKTGLNITVSNLVKNKEFYKEMSKEVIGLSSLVSLMPFGIGTYMASFITGFITKFTRRIGKKGVPLFRAANIVKKWESFIIKVGLSAFTLLNSILPAKEVPTNFVETISSEKVRPFKVAKARLKPRATLADLRSRIELSKVHRNSIKAWKQEMNLDEPPSCDVVIYSAGTRDMSDYYEQRSETLEEITYRSDIPILFISDPEVLHQPGARVGNGGAIGNCLLELKERLAELQAGRNPDGTLRYPHLQGKTIDQLSIVLVQAGGFGKRYTPGSSDGSKTLLPVPIELPNGEIATMMDIVLMNAYKFTRKLKENKRQGGLVILNGDGLLITEPQIIDGIGLITNPESIENAAKKLGVVVTDEKGRIIKFFEKPSEEEMEEDEILMSAIDMKDKVIRQIDSNTGSFAISHSDHEAYAKFLNAFLKINELVRERIENKKPVYEIDTVGEYFIPLTVAKEEYLKIKKLDKPDAAQDEKEFYSEIYDIVTDEFPGLYAVKTDAEKSAYADYGDVKTWYRGLMTENIIAGVVKYKSRIQALISPDDQIDKSARIYKSMIEAGVRVGQESIIFGAHLFKGSVVYNVEGEVDIGDDLLLNQCPVKTKDGRTVHAILFTGRDDKLKGKVKDVNLFGKPSKEFLERLKDKEGKVFGIPVTEDTNFMKLEIWPVTESNEVNMELVSWMGDPTRGPPEVYLNAPKVSFDYITKNVSYPGITARNNRINDLISPVSSAALDIPLQFSGLRPAQLSQKRFSPETNTILLLPSLSEELLDKSYQEPFSLLNQLAYFRGLDSEKQTLVQNELAQIGKKKLANFLFEYNNKDLNSQLNAIEKRFKLKVSRDEILRCVQLSDRSVSSARALRIGKEILNVPSDSLKQIVQDSKIVSVINGLKSVEFIDKWSKQDIKELKKLLWAFRQIDGSMIRILDLPNGRRVIYDEYALRKVALDKGLSLAVTREGLEHLIKIDLQWGEGIFSDLARAKIKFMEKNLIHGLSKGVLQGLSKENFVLWDEEKHIYRADKLSGKVFEIEKPKVDVVSIATMNREEALRNELEAELEAQRIFNYKVPVIVIDDSIDEILNKDREIIEELSSKYGIPIYHITGKEKEEDIEYYGTFIAQQYQKELDKGNLSVEIKSLLERHKILSKGKIDVDGIKEYLKKNVFFHISGVRNYTLLQSIGKVLMNIDDDAPPETYVLFEKDRKKLEAQRINARTEQMRNMCKEASEILGQSVKDEDDLYVLLTNPNINEKLKSLQEKYFAYSPDGKTGFIPMAMGEITSLASQYINEELKLTHQRYQSLMTPLPEYMVTISDFVYLRPRSEKAENKYMVMPVNTIGAAKLIGKKAGETNLPLMGKDLRGTMGEPISNEEKAYERLKDKRITYIAYPFINDQDTSGLAQFVRYLEMPEKTRVNLQHTDQSAIISDGVGGFVSDTNVIFNRAVLEVIPMPTIGRDLRLEEPPFIKLISAPVSKGKVTVAYSPVAGGQQREIGERMYIISTQDFTEVVGGISRGFYEQAVSNYYEEIKDNPELLKEHNIKGRLKTLGKNYIEIADRFNLSEEQKRTVLRERKIRASLIAELGRQRGEKINQLNKETVLEKRKELEQEIRDIDLILVQYADDFSLYKAKNRKQEDYTPQDKDDYFYKLKR